MKKVLTFLMVFLLCGTVVAGQKDEIVAQVGPCQLTKAEFDYMIQNVPPQIKLLLKQQPKLKENLLRRWAQITLLSLAARQQGIDKKPEIKARIRDTVNQILAQEYLSKKVLSKVKKVTDKEAKDFYEKHKDLYIEPEAIHARHILIQVSQNASKKEKEAALKKAQQIYEKLLKGEDFSTLAKKYSADPGTRDKGGDLGFFTRGQMIKEFEDAAFALKVGEISPPVRTPLGYHIIKVEEKRPAKQKSYEEVKQQIKQELLQQRQEELLFATLSELEKQYPIKIYPERLE